MKTLKRNTYKMYYSADTKASIIEAIARDTKLHREIERIVKTNKIDDLLQELYISLLTKDDAVIIGLNERNEIKFYIIRIIISQFYGKKSRYYRLFKKDSNHVEFEPNINDEMEFNLENKRSLDEYTTKINEENALDFKTKNINEKIIFINKELAKLDWYDRDVYKHYEGQEIGYRKLAKKLNIPHVSLYYTVTGVRKKIQEAYKQYLKDKKDGNDRNL